MKVLSVYNWYHLPGGEDVVFCQERQMLERAGHEVVVYERSNREIDAYSPIRLPGLAKRAVWAKDSRDEFARLLKRKRPDLVHIHNFFIMMSPSIFWACKEAGVPVVMTLHNYRLLCPAATLFRDGHTCEECVDHSLLRAVQHGCYHNSRTATAVVSTMVALHWALGTWTNLVDCYIALTEFSRRKFIEGGLPPEKITVKPNFVDLDPGERTNDGTYVVFVGRLSPGKCGTLLAAWEKLGAQIPLRILGGGPELRQLEQESKRRKLSQIAFYGHLPREQALSMIRGARFLMFPSEVYENFPMTIAESFACGTPVICARLGAMREIVEDGRTGLHFNPGDAADLASKVDWAWAHRERMKCLGKEARNEYKNKYTAEKNYPQLMEIYQRTIQSAAKTACSSELSPASAVGNNFP